MTGREVYALYRSSHGQEKGERLENFDALPNADRMVWDRLAHEVSEEIMNDLRERGIMWEPTS
jgi:hypothetical protein